MGTVDLDLVRTFEQWTNRELRNNTIIDDLWAPGARDPLKVASGFPAGLQTLAISMDPNGANPQGNVVGRVRVRIKGTVNGAPYQKDFDMAPDDIVIVDGRGMERAGVAILASNIALTGSPDQAFKYQLRVTPTPYEPTDAAQRHAWLYETYPSTTDDYIVPNGFVVSANDPGMVFRHYNSANPSTFVDFPWAATIGDVQPIGGRYFRTSVAGLQVAWRIKL